jgi:hypothetical protein
MAWDDFLGNPFTGGDTTVANTPSTISDEAPAEMKMPDSTINDILKQTAPAQYDPGMGTNILDTLGIHSGTLDNILGTQTSQMHDLTRLPSSTGISNADMRMQDNSAIQNPQSPSAMDMLKKAYGNSIGKISGQTLGNLGIGALGTAGAMAAYNKGNQGLNAASANQQAALDAANRLNILQDPEVAKIQDNAQQLAARGTALQGLQDRATMGLTPQDQADLNNIRNQSNQQFQANQNQISENMARRGMGNSGMGLAQSLGASQAQLQNTSQQGDQLAAMSFNAKQNALNNLANNTNQMLTSDFNRNQVKANATDSVSQFNTNQQNARDRAVQNQQNNMATFNQNKGSSQAAGIGNIFNAGAGAVGTLMGKTANNTQQDPNKKV